MSKTKATTWRCPECKRVFARNSQAHSCKVASLESHLGKASPEALKIYAVLDEALRRCGPLRAVPTKSQINLMARTSFGGLAIRRNHLVLGFVLTRQVESPRLFSTLQLSPRTFAYKVRLESPTDVDDELWAWLREAYRVGLAGGRRDPTT
jgi:hypothetical protein